MATILVADDEHAICMAFQQILGEQGHRVITVSNAPDAISTIAANNPAAVFLDIQLPGQNGLEALASIRERWPAIPVIMMTAFGTVDTASRAIEGGAFDYLGKPLELPQIRRVLDRALQTFDAKHALPAEQAHRDELVGTSAIMQETFKMLSILSRNDITALISGEIGVGKELAARTIHLRSSRADKPFLVLDCSAMPETAIEIQLFGGGSADRGPNEPYLAQPGTLLLKDVFSLPRHVQSRLARALQEKRFDTAGSMPTGDLNTRVIATTTREPGDDPATTHTDLYYQLSLVNLTIPPLRARLEDLPVLIRHFIARANAQLTKSVRDFDDGCLDILRAYPWPNNVAELEQVIMRAVLMTSSDVLAPQDLSIPTMPTAFAHISDPDIEEIARMALRYTLENNEAGENPTERPFYAIVDRVEQALIEEALQQADGNQVAASELLGISRTTLRTKKGL